MSKNKPVFISFEKKNNTFIGFISIDAVLNNNIDQRKVLAKATKIYANFINEAEKYIDDLESQRFISARSVWKLGDAIFRLTNSYETMGLQLDRIYDHLSRDLGKKRKWLEKVVIFRRYLKKIDLIPEAARWGYFEKSTKNKILNLLKKNKNP